MSLDANPLHPRCVNRAEAEAESILEQETLLGIPLTDNLTALSNLRETLEPMARLWTTAKEYLDSHHSWLESPLRTVNAEEAERKVGRANPGCRSAGHTYNIAE